jgi:GT2 family glycosyltransferase
MIATGAPCIATPSVAVVLVNWNGWRDTLECIDTILAQDHRNFHIFIVDNESADDSLEQIRAWCDSPSSDPAWREQSGVRHWSQGGVTRIPYRMVERPDTLLPPAGSDCRITMIRSGANLGFAGGCNVAVRAAGIAAFEFFWFLNNDTVIAANALGELLRRACIEPKPGITGSTIRYYDAPHLVQAMGGAHMDVERATARHIGADASVSEIPANPAEVERNMDYVMGASMLVSRDFIREIGLMQEDYFLFFEEIDWAIRGRGKFTLAYAPRSHVLHKWAASSHRAVGFATRFFYRNRIRFTSRFYPENLRKTRRSLLMEMLRHAARGRWLHVGIIAAVLRDAGALAAEARSLSESCT